MANLRWEVVRNDPRRPSRKLGGRDGRVYVGFAGAAKIFNIENEGESHDIIENKGANFLSHDIYDK